MNENPIKEEKEEEKEEEKWESLPEDDQSLVQRIITGISTGKERDTASVEVIESVEELLKKAQPK